MKTLYVDVYFLLNFTVDLLSVYFASKIARVPMRAFNFILIAILGALYAVVGALIGGNALFDILLFSASCVLFFLFVGRKVSFFRRLKVFVFFVILMALIGGLVNFLYLILSKYVEYEPTQAPENRRLLTLSILIIFSFGIIKLISLLFARNSSAKNATLSISFLDRKIEFDALVDTGNLLVDPIDSTPVMLITPSLAKRIIPTGVPRELSSITPDLKRYVRVIPVSKGKISEIYIGFVPECLEIKRKRKWERIKMIFAVELDSRGYGGYEALVPGSVLE